MPMNKLHIRDDQSPMDITAFLKSTGEQIEQRLHELVPQKCATHSSLFNAARYSLLGGGKRLRPILTVATAHTLGAPSPHALNAACAIEMIHTYSLIHDDLPCMDDDDFRRGKPSLHKAFSEGHAVLTGDYLLTYAFEVIAADPLLQPIQKVELISLLARNSGGDGMIGGQIMDIEAESRQIDLDSLREIHRCKTGAMITASVEFGGIIAKATSSQLETLRHFGNTIGLAFQIIDDVIDITSSKAKHGKEVASDAINNKMTYATLLGIENARTSAYELLDQAQRSLSDLRCDTSLLKGLAYKLVHREI